MIFCIVTHVEHTEYDGRYFAYAPYINEMNIWGKNVDEIVLVAAQKKFSISPIHTFYTNSKVSFFKIKEFDLVSIKGILRTFFAIPLNCWIIFRAMHQADHIHLRCPGNIGLLGALVQILFPNKKKTAKYAGNWDPESKQPWSYRLQKWILRNTFLTRNMRVLVYGEWQNQSKNIKPFFTATYTEADKKSIQEKSLTQQIRFIFVGTLVKGKNPLYAIQLIEELSKKGYAVHLDLYGEGIERGFLENYISKNNLEKVVNLKGNQSKDIVIEAYQKSHFIVLPSKSEGWPKAIAEGMFWGCVPIATSISCVPFMLDYGNRGVLLQMNLDKDAEEIYQLIDNPKSFQKKGIAASNWSQNYTLDYFEKEIELLLQPNIK